MAAEGFALPFAITNALCHSGPERRVQLACRLLFLAMIKVEAIQDL
jgi:hypothetical protein